MHSVLLHVVVQCTLSSTELMLMKGLLNTNNIKTLHSLLSTLTKVSKTYVVEFPIEEQGIVFTLDESLCLVFVERLLYLMYR